MCTLQMSQSSPALTGRSRPSSIEASLALTPGFLSPDVMTSASMMEPAVAAPVNIQTALRQFSHGRRHVRRHLATAESYTSIPAAADPSTARVASRDRWLAIAERRLLDLLQRHLILVLCIGRCCRQGVMLVIRLQGQSTPPCVSWSSTCAD